MNNTSPIATPDATSRWDTMSDFTRIGVGLALGLSVMTFVVMCSMAGPMIRGATAWLRQLAWLPALTYQTVTTGYLACLYAAVVAVGVAHAQRTTTALAERRPKSSGKPHVGDGPFWTWGAVMAVSTVAGVLCGLISLGSPPEAVGALVFALVVGGHHTRMHWLSTLSRGVGLAAAAGQAWSTFAELHIFTELAATPECGRDNELDADKAAVLLLKSSGLYDQKAVATMLTTFANTSDTDSHPSASNRIRAIAEIF